MGGYSFGNLSYKLDKGEGIDFFDKNIIVLDAQNGQKKKQIAFEYMSIPALSPSGEYFAVATIVDAEKEEMILNTELLIYDSHTCKKIKIIKNILFENTFNYFSWSPSEHKIAYIVGKTAPEGHIRYNPTGVFIYDIDADKTVKIANKAFKINWSPHDNNIYIQKEDRKPSKIHVYNTKAGKLTKSNKRGMVFSDDGKYYISTEIKREIFSLESHFIYDNAANKKIYKFKFKEEKEGLGYFEYAGTPFFIHGNSNLILFYEFKQYRVFSIKDRKIINTEKQNIIGWNKDMTKVVVYNGGRKFIHINEFLTRRHLKSINIPKH